MAVKCKVLVRLAANNYILATLIRAIKVYSFQQISHFEQNFLSLQPFPPVCALVHP